MLFVALHARKNALDCFPCSQPMQLIESITAPNHSANLFFKKILYYSKVSNVESTKLQIIYFIIMCKRVSLSYWVMNCSARRIQEVQMPFVESIHN